MTTTLLLSALLTGIAGTLFCALGRTVTKRQVSREERPALWGYGLWWYGLAALSFYGVAINTAAALGYTSLSLLLALLHLLLPILFAALWGLGYALTYLYTGNHFIRVPLAIFYAGLNVWVEYLVAAAHPNGLRVTEWSVSLTYERDLAEDPSSFILGLLITVPLLLAAIAYFSLFFRTSERGPRFRIALVGGSFILWFGIGQVASLAGWSRLDFWPPVSNVISVLAALVMLIAYHPPKRIKRWLAADSGSSAPDDMPAQASMKQRTAVTHGIIAG